MLTSETVTVGLGRHARVPAIVVWRSGLSRTRGTRGVGPPVIAGPEIAGNGKATTPSRERVFPSLIMTRVQ